jgi:hypothetical protein
MATRPELIAELLELPPKEREDLARTLLDSVDDQDEAEYVPTPEEAAEIDAALAEASGGGGVPAQDFLRQLTATR